jgi:hypothetical protein
MLKSTWNLESLQWLGEVTCPPSFPHLNVEFAQPFERATNATEPFYRSPNNGDDERTGSWNADGRGLPQAWRERRIVLQVQSRIWWHALHVRVSLSDVPRANVSYTHYLRALDDENAKLKRLLADTMLDNIVLKDLLGKNSRYRMYDGPQHARQWETMKSRSGGQAYAWLADSQYKLLIKPPLVRGE